MKGVTGGMKWFIISVIIGIVAVVLLYIFMTGAGNAVLGIFPGLIDAAGQMMCTVIGRAPLIGIFMRC
jgi:hypothetical protein